MRELSAGLFYLFCDEKYDEFPSCKRFLMGHIAVPQAGWNSISDARRDLSEPINMSRMARVHKLVEDIDGVALVTYADLRWKYLPQGQRDSIGDIMNMARTDHIWSVLMVYGVVQTLKWLELHNLMVKNVDGYYDTRTIKPRHRDAWAQVLTDELRKQIQKLSQQGFANAKYRPRIRRFRDTPKAAKGDKADKFQTGIDVAHHLLQFNRDIIASGDRGRVHKFYNTTYITNYLKRGGFYLVADDFSPTTSAQGAKHLHPPESTRPQTTLIRRATDRDRQQTQSPPRPRAGTRTGGKGPAR